MTTSARDLSARLADLLRHERAALADFLVALADFDRRRLWVELGYSSLFYFLHRELGLSKGAAFYRKTAAELIDKCPELVEPLRDGRLCLTSIVELAKVLTPENRDEVLPRFFHASKAEAKVVSAALQPDSAAPHRDMVTPVRAPIPALDRAAPRSPEEFGEKPAVHPANPPHAKSELAPRQVPPPRDAVEPLTADLRRFHVTVSRRFLEKLAAARDALSHAQPGASTEEILEASLDLLLEQHAKKKGVVAKPRREPPPAKADHLAAHVKRAVWLRDDGRCQWALDSGGICGSTHQVEFDHVQARAKGGPSTIENIRLLCNFHNGVAARQTFGDAWMDRFTAGRSAPARASRDAAGVPA